MNIFNHKFLAVAFLMGGAWTMAHGQTDKKLDQTVQVVREYSPTVSNAGKMYKNPIMDDTSSYRPVFRYSIIDRVTSVSTDPEVIQAARMSYKNNELLYKSLLRAGAGNYGSIGGDYYYNVANNEEFLFGLHLGHLTSMGRLKLEDNTKVDAPFFHTSAGLNFKKFFDRYTFGSALQFDHHIYQFYGLKAIDPDAEYVNPSLIPSVLGSQLLGDKNERLAGFNAGFTLDNAVNTDAAVDFTSAVNIHLFSTKTGVKQTGFGFGGTASFPIDELKGGIDVSFDHFKVGIPDSIGPLYWFKERSSSLLRIQPHVDLDFGLLKLRAGIAIMTLIEKNNDEFYLMPDVKAVWDVAEDYVSLFAALKGDVRTNSYRSVIEENPFVSADVNVMASASPIEIEGGVDARFSDVVNLKVKLGYSAFTDEHFFMNKKYVSTIPGMDGYSNRFVPLYSDGTLFKASAELVVRPGKNSSIVAHATYFGWEVDNIEKAWHKPESEFGVRWRFFPVSKLVIDGGLTIIGQRYALDPLTDTAKKLKAAYDVNLGGEYFVTQQFSLFTRLNNIAATKYYQWNGYPTHGINVFAGISYSF